MTEVQVKCRRCRLILLSEEFILNSHGETTVQGGLENLDCGLLSGTASTHLFISFEHGPSWIADIINQSSYTKGKLLCPKCQGRLGSFDFVKSARRCSCGKSIQPPVHLLRDRVDIFDSRRHGVVKLLVADYTLPTSLTHRKTTEEDEGGSLRTSYLVAKFQKCPDLINLNANDTESLHLEWLFEEGLEERISRPCELNGSSGTNELNKNTDRPDYKKKTSLRLSKGERNQAWNLSMSLSRDTKRRVPFSQVNTSIHRHLRRRQRRTEAGDGDNEELQWYQDSRVELQSSNTHGYSLSISHRYFAYHPLEKERQKNERKDEKKKLLESEDVSFEHTCPMCLEVMLNPHKTLPCQHNFCECCLRRLSTISSPVKGDCPLCRQRIAKCVPSSGLERTIMELYPHHIRARRREEKRSMQRAKSMPLPGLTFPQNYLSRLRLPSARLWPITKLQLAFIVFMVMALPCVGMGICHQVLVFVSGVFDNMMEKQTNEKLWPSFVGVETPVMTVGTVFVLYLVCSFMVKYVHIFQEIQN